MTEREWTLKLARERFERNVPVLAPRQFQIDTLSEIQQVMRFDNSIYADLLLILGICKTKKEARRLADEG